VKGYDETDGNEVVIFPSKYGKQELGVCRSKSKMLTKDSYYPVVSIKFIEYNKNLIHTKSCIGLITLKDLVTQNKET